MFDVNASYVCGFFDGEGCLLFKAYQTTQGRKYQVRATIANTNIEILQDIAFFLKENNINSYFRSLNPTQYPSIRGNKVCHYLNIVGYSNVCNFIRLVKPRHARFKEKIPLLLERENLLINKEKEKIKRIETITALCIEGLTHIEISKLVGINEKHTYRYCRNPRHKHHFPKNPQHLNRY